MKLPDYPAKDSPMSKAWLCDWLKDAVDYMRAVTVTKCVGGLATISHAGTSLEIKIPRQTTAASVTADKPAFYTYASSATGVKVTGGRIIHPANGVVVAVAESAELTVDDGDLVWLEMTAALTWAANNGPSYPTDKLYFPLASVAVASTVTVTHIWAGGDIPFNERFQVTLASDGGSAGDSATACTFTYTATSLAGVELATALTPELSPARIYPWTTVAATKGEVYLNAAGQFKLWSCNETQDMEWQENRVDPCDMTFCAEVNECVTE